jgi:biopolymer transport protein TolR
MMAEINVTPMVDVMLVLLIIFMVTAPLLTSGVNVDLPKTSASPVNETNKPITVTIDAQGKIYLQDQSTEIAAADLVAKLQALATNDVGQQDNDRRIFVRADKSISYGQVLEVMGNISQGGFNKVSLLADQPAAATPSPQQ